MAAIFLFISGENIIIALISVIFSGGLFAAWNAKKKLPSEIGKTTIDIAEGAVLVQKGVIEDLRTDILRLKDNIREVKTESDLHEKENEQCKKALTRLEELLRKHGIRIEYIERGEHK